jgi:plastocyanin
VPIFTRRDRDAVGAGSLILALLAALLAFAALVTAANAGDGDGGGGGGAAPAGATEVTLSDLAISPKEISVSAGATLAVANKGAIVHNFVVEGTDFKTKDLDAGESATLDLTGLEEGTHNVSCSIPGHKEAGMVATLTVGAGHAGGGGATGGDDPETLRANNDAADKLQKEPVDAYVAQLKEGANTKGVGNSGMKPVTPKIEANGVKRFDLTAAITDWEVEPGKVVKAWTYNGTVPGPWIKVEPGDRVKIVLKNELPQSTAVHFHGIETPLAMDGVPFVTQDPVKPDKTFTYEFVAKGPAMGMYHSHHHAEHQVPDGLLGVFQVGDPPLPEGVGPVTQRIPMVLNDAGVIGLSLNGKSFPATAPVMAKPGEWVELTYYNEGLQIHPMHLHGIPQLVIGKDGFPLAAPYRADTVNVAPGERYTVLINPTADHLGPNNGPGVWAFHCHILTHAEREEGMFGMVTTFIVTPSG